MCLIKKTGIGLLKVLILSVDFCDILLWLVEFHNFSPHNCLTNFMLFSNNWQLNFRIFFFSAIDYEFHNRILKQPIEKFLIFLGNQVVNFSLVTDNWITISQSIFPLQMIDKFCNILFLSIGIYLFFPGPFAKFVGSFYTVDEWILQIFAVIDSWIWLFFPINHNLAIEFSFFLHNLLIEHVNFSMKSID